MPDVASEPTNVIVTGWLYQPFESAARSTDAEPTVGASVSILNCSENCVVAWPSVALQFSVSLLVLNVFASGQLESVTFPSTESFTDTALRYQPLSPGVTAVIV